MRTSGAVALPTDSLRFRPIGAGHALVRGLGRLWRDPSGASRRRPGKEPGMSQAYEQRTGHVYDGRGGASTQWWSSRYGPDDELGAGNELTAERTLEALKIPREGRTIELAQLLEEGVPAFPPRWSPQSPACSWRFPRCSATTGLSTICVPSRWNWTTLHKNWFPRWKRNF